MKKYFYTNGVDKIGPFSFEEFKKQDLTNETKVWFYGLDNWITLSEVEELNSITSSIPPKLKIAKAKETQNTIEPKITKQKLSIKKEPIKTRKKLKRVIVIIALSIIVLLIGFIAYNRQEEDKFYQNIVNSAYDTDADFDFYVKKFYRDVEVFGIFPKKPKTTIIKFAKLDQLDDATHIHGLSYGMNDDDRIEIYINPSTWKSFNKPMRYYLMYHELSHDVLNVDDLKDLPNNEGKLMYPAIATYESKTMDDFIESSHELFEEVAAKQNY